VALKTSKGMACVSLAAPSALADGAKLSAQLQSFLPSAAQYRSTSTLAESLTLMHSVFSEQEVVQWEPYEDEEECGAVSVIGPLLGSHNGFREFFWLHELLPAGTVGTDVSARFCAQLRRDSFVPLLLSKRDSDLYHAVEAAASSWFAMSEDEKLESGGAYGHIDRKFTGYRAGKFREQLEVRATAAGGVYPWPERPSQMGPLLLELMSKLDGWSRNLLAHISHDVGAPGFFEGLLDPISAAVQSSPPVDVPADEVPVLGHPLVRICKYASGTEGVFGSNVLCEAHNDVGFITLDPCASNAGLEALRRSDSMWVPIEHAAPPEGAQVLLVMVGDTLGRSTANYYAPCKHRVVAPQAGERIGLPYLFRGRSDAVLNTMPARQAAAAKGRTVHLAEMETTTIKELPAFDSAKAILKNWFKSVKAGKDDCQE